MGLRPRAARAIRNASRRSRLKISGDRPCAKAFWRVIPCSSESQRIESSRSPHRAGATPTIWIQRFPTTGIATGPQRGSLARWAGISWRHSPSGGLRSVGRSLAGWVTSQPGASRIDPRSPACASAGRAWTQPVKGAHPGEWSSSRATRHQRAFIEPPPARRRMPRIRVRPGVRHRVSDPENRPPPPFMEHTTLLLVVGWAQ